jgi:hypothetical protein
MNRYRSWHWVWLVLAGLVLAACADTKPYEPSYNPGDIPPGPGVLTGKDGDFTVYRK